MNINKTEIEAEAVYNCKFCGENVYKCDKCDEFLCLFAEMKLPEIYCDTSNPDIKHYCQECGEEHKKQMEEKEKGIK